MAKLQRDAFLYLEPKDKKDEKAFAQCGTCSMFVTKGLCTILGPDVPIKASDSCGLYVEGEPLQDGKTVASVTPEEAGLVHRQVRCENCLYFDTDDSTCELFEKLNAEMPDCWTLDVDVSANGCCNANMPSASKGANEMSEPKATYLDLRGNEVHPSRAKQVKLEFSDGTTVYSSLAGGAAPLPATFGGPGSGRHADAGGRGDYKEYDLKMKLGKAVSTGREARGQASMGMYGAHAKAADAFKRAADLASKLNDKQKAIQYERMSKDHALKASRQKDVLI
jgi:hypothetical protein